MRAIITKERIRSLPYGLAAAFAMAWTITIPLPDSLQIIQSQSDSVGVLALMALSALLILAFSPAFARLLARKTCMVAMGAACFTAQLLCSLAAPWLDAPSSIVATLTWIVLCCIVAIFAVSALVSCLIRLTKTAFFDCVLLLVSWQGLIACILAAETVTGIPIDSYIAPFAIPALLFLFDKKTATEVCHRKADADDTTTEPELAKIGFDLHADADIDDSNANDQKPNIGIGGHTTVRLPYRLFIIYALFIFAIYLINSIANMQAYPAFLGMFAALILMFGLLAATRHILPVRMLYYTAILLLEAAIVIFSLDSLPADAAALMFMRTSYAVFAAFFFSVLCSYCRRSGVDSIRVFASSYLIECLAAICGSVVANQMIPELVTFTFVLLGALIALVGATFSTDEDFRTEWGATKREPNHVDPVRYMQNVSNACTSIVMQYSLSPRESDVLMLLAQRKTVPQIADDLVVTQATIKSHTNSIYKKLGIHSRKELFALIGLDGLKDF